MEPLPQWWQAIERLGFPAAALIAGCVVLWRVVPKLYNFLTALGDTQQKILILLEKKIERSELDNRALSARVDQIEQALVAKIDTGLARAETAICAQLARMSAHRAELEPDGPSSRRTMPSGPVRTDIDSKRRL